MYTCNQKIYLSNGYALHVISVFIRIVFCLSIISLTNGCYYSNQKYGRVCRSMYVTFRLDLIADSGVFPSFLYFACFTSTFYQLPSTCRASPIKSIYLLQTKKLCSFFFYTIIVGLEYNQGIAREPLRALF